jgi:hypothetical protein
MKIFILITFFKTLIMQQPHQAAAAYQILSQSQIPSSTHATQQLISSGGNVGQHQNVNVSLGMPVTSVSMSQVFIFITKNLLIFRAMLLQALDVLCHQLLCNLLRRLNP